MKQFSLMASVACLSLCSTVSAAATNREGRAGSDHNGEKVTSIGNGFGITGSGSASSRDHGSKAFGDSKVTSIDNGLDSAPGGGDLSPPSSRQYGHSKSSSVNVGAGASSPRLSPATAGF